jgi:hypothetical protein
MCYKSSTASAGVKNDLPPTPNYADSQATRPDWMTDPAAFPGPEAPFTGNSRPLAESRVRPAWGIPMLVLGRATGPREVHMAKRQTPSSSFLAVGGALLLSLGLLLLFANLDEIAARIGNSSTGTSLTTVMELGLAGMRAVQAYVFDQPTFQAGLHTILVSFWPLILVIIGATLLRNAISKRFAKPRLAQALLPGEYESE